MTHDQHPVPGTGSSPDTSTNHTPNRLQQAHKLFADLSGELLRITSDDSRLQLPADTEPILRSVLDYAGRYDGPLAEQPFLDWAESIILPQRQFYAIKRQCERSVLSAIWRSLGHSTEPNKYDDYSETVREIAAEVWFWTFQHIPELSRPGTAALTTRLYARAQIMTRAWLKKHRTRRNAVIRQVYGLGSVKAAQEMAARLDSAEKDVAERRAIRAEMELAELAVQPE